MSPFPMPLLSYNTQTYAHTHMYLRNNSVSMYETVQVYDFLDALIQVHGALVAIWNRYLLLTGSEERGGSIHIVILPSCQYMQIIALYLHKINMNIVGQYSSHNTDRCPMSLSRYNSLREYCAPHTASSVFHISVFWSIF